MTTILSRCRLCAARLPTGTPEGLCPLCDDGDEAEGLNGVRVLGDCELFEELGRGGMGVVWRGRQRGLDRPVAVKTLPGGDLAGAEARARFRLEAQAAARLRHPNIVAIHDVGEADGMPYFVMELVKGRTLAAEIAAGLPPARVAARWVQEAALAVQHAHEHGVLHRDLKPSNILIEPDSSGGRPRVMDFGLAKLTDTESGLTMSGSAAGSPAYMPPETVRGIAATAAGDIYGLGAVLYAALTGRAPFLGENMAAILAQVEKEEPLAPRRLHAGVPRDLETICLKCLEKNPARRYAAAQSLADDLSRFLRGEPVLARPVSTPARVIRWAARRPALAAALALAVLALVATAVTATVAAVRINDARSRAVASAAAESRQADEALRRAVDLHVAEANRRQADGDLIASLPPLVAALRADTDDPARRSAHMMRLATALRQCPRVQHHWTTGGWRDRRETALTYPGRVYSADWSPDGKWIACATLARVHFWDVETGEDHGADFPEENAVYVKFSADGSRLITGTSRNTISLWEVETRAPVFRGLRHDLNGTLHSAVVPPAMDRAARRIVRLEPGDGLTAGLYAVVPDIKSPDGTPLQIPLRLAPSIRSFALSPDGSVLAAGHDSGGVALHETISWAPVGRVLPVRQLPRVLSFSPDNKRLAILAGPNTMELWQLDADPPARLSSAAHTGYSYRLAWSPDGTRVASAGYGMSGSLVLRGDSGITECVLRQPPGLLSAVWSMDGTRLLTGGFDNAARLFDPLTGEPAGPPLPHGAFVSAALWSPDGQRVFTGSHDGTARLWELPALEEPEDSVNFKFSRRQRCMARRDTKAGTLSTLVIYSLAEGRELGRTGPGRCGGVSEDGRVLVYFGRDRWELHDFPGGAVRVLSQFTSTDYESAPATRRAELSPDGSRALLSTDQRTWRVYDVSTEQAQELGRIDAGTVVKRHTFSADGRRFAVSTSLPRREQGSHVSIWNLDTLEMECRFTTPEYAAQIEFSPDGALIAWGGIIGGLVPSSARIHRSTDGQPVTPFLPHRGDVQDLEFSPDARFLLTGCEDGSARLWDAATGALAAPELPHRAIVGDVAFNADGTRLVTLAKSVPAVMRVWETASGAALTPPMPLGKGVEVCRFTSDGAALVSAGRILRRWPLTWDDRTADELVEEAEYLSARRHDPVTGERPIPPAALRGMAEQRKSSTNH